MNEFQVYKNSLALALRPLATMYSQQLSHEQANGYITLLAALNISPDVLQLAVLSLLTKSKFIPTVAEILNEIRWLNSSTDLDSFTAWSHVQEVAATQGFEKGLTFLTETEAQAAKAIGWRDICYGSQSDLAIRRAHFAKAFQAITDRMKAEHQRSTFLTAVKNESELNLAVKIQSLAHSKAF